jgi:hypothetical protein
MQKGLPDTCLADIWHVAVLSRNSDPLTRRKLLTVLELRYADLLSLSLSLSEVYSNPRPRVISSFTIVHFHVSLCISLLFLVAFTRLLLAVERGVRDAVSFACEGKTSCRSFGTPTGKSP